MTLMFLSNAPQNPRREPVCRLDGVADKSEAKLI